MQGLTFIAAIGVITGLGVAGALCMFKAQTLTDRVQRKDRKRPLREAWPHSNVVMKPWYPLYLRCMGLLLWVADVVVFYLAFFPEAAR
jgi:hypothetical protein